MVEEFLGRGRYWKEVVRRSNGGDILWQELATVAAAHGLELLWILLEWAEQNKPAKAVKDGEGSNGFKKCPWCGDEVIVEEKPHISEGFGEIGCGHSGCPGKSIYYHYGIEKAREDWNRRVIFK